MHLRAADCGARCRNETAMTRLASATTRTTKWWRRHVRSRALQEALAATELLPWSAELLNLLLEELYVDESLEELLGTAPTRLKRRQYPQAIAAALMLRHSWNEDDLAYILGRLGFTAETTVSDVRPTKRHRLAVLSAGTTASRSRVPREY